MTDTLTPSRRRRSVGWTAVEVLVIALCTAGFVWIAHRVLVPWLTLAAIGVFVVMLFRDRVARWYLLYALVVLAVWKLLSLPWFLMLVAFAMFLVVPDRLKDKRLR